MSALNLALNKTIELLNNRKSLREVLKKKKSASCEVGCGKYKVTVIVEEYKWKKI